MQGAPFFSRVFVIGALIATTGCVRWTHLAPSELQINGKAGQFCSALVTPLVWSVNTVFFPVSVASLGRTPPSHDNLGYPGLAVENSAYFACATLALPLFVLGRGTEQVASLLAGREAVEDRLIERLPDLSQADYALLVRTAGRTCPPLYDRETSSTVPSVPGTAPPREFGLWSTGQVPRFGSKPRLGSPLAAAEWRDWRAAGRPRDERSEITFIVNRSLEFPDPTLQIAATYGLAHQSRFKDELKEQRARAAAAGLASLAEPQSVAALGRAMSDPDRLVRERAAFALGTIGSAAAADVLLRSLGSIGHRARFQALCALAAAGSPGAGEAFSRALEDQDLHTRIAAAAAIGRTAASPDDQLLLRALGDPDPRISEAAGHARERRGDPGVSR